MKFHPINKDKFESKSVLRMNSDTTVEERRLSAAKERAQGNRALAPAALC